MASDNIVNAHLQQRRGTAALWTQVNPVLAVGEIGYVTDTKTIRIGDGVTPWKNLPEFKAVNAGNADTLGGVAPSGYLAVNGKAVDADKLDGYDTATAATPNTVAIRDANGRLTVATPAASTDASTKGYVDTQVASAVAPPIPSEMYLNTWSVRTGPSIAGNPYGIAWSPTLGLFAMVTTAGQIATSPDGITWTNRTSPTTNNIRHIIWVPDFLASGGCFYGACGAANNAVYSPDGINWTLLSLPSWGVGIGYSSAQKKIVVAGGNGSANAVMILTTPANLNMVSGYTHPHSMINDVVWAPELSLWVSVSSWNAITTGLVATSPDAINWTVRTTPSGMNNMAPLGIAWSPTLRLFVMVGNATPYVATSPDGLTWTARALPQTMAMNRVIWSAELGVFVAVGNPSSVGVSPVITSPDGLSWTPRLPGMYMSMYDVASSSTKKMLCAIPYVSGANGAMVVNTLAQA